MQFMHRGLNIKWDTLFPPQNDPQSTLPYPL